AGQAAARATLAAGLATALVDEQPSPGGQILRQPPTGYAVAGWMAARLYRPLRRLLATTEANIATAPGLHWLGATSVAGIWPEGDGFALHLSGASAGLLRARRVLVATGCYDMPVALPGWTLPGVLSAGGVQTMLKAQQVVAGRRFVLFGSHPLQLVLAQQLVEAGADVAAVLFAQPRGRMLIDALPHLAGAMRTPAPLLAAFGATLALHKAGVRVVYDAAVRALLPNARGDELGALEYASGGEIHRIDCDTAAQCYGFLPQSDLPRQAGAQVAWAQPAGGWATLCDGWMRSSVPGLYVAGETTGVAGADLAMTEGAIAGLAIALDSGRMTTQAAAREHGMLTARHRRLAPFAALLRAVADPRQWLPVADDDTLLCRCEDVSAARVEATIADLAKLGQPTASAVKQRCRIGMGLCQGRSCEHALVRQLAAANGTTPDAIAPLRVRFPVRPLPIDEVLDPQA
ncbi:MAG TPA: FAD-dependent oxidoreductase, partial [Novosphingobium sp.]|nr:FAD-dependent oxidoreductase [Novosphingobium sp.]